MKLQLGYGLLPSKGIFDLMWESHVGAREYGQRDRLWDMVCDRTERYHLGDPFSGAWTERVLGLLGLAWTEIRFSGEYAVLEVTNDGQAQGDHTSVRG